jgi:hypothetical protein
MANGKELSQDELEAQMVARVNKQLELKQAQREENVVRLGARVVNKETIPGKPIIIRETGQQKVDGNGVPQCYADKYKVTLQFMGGSLITDVNQPNYDALELHKTFLCVGHYGEVKKFGESFMEPIFTNYTRI